MKKQDGGLILKYRLVVTRLEGYEVQIEVTTDPVRTDTVNGTQQDLALLRQIVL